MKNIFSKTKALLSWSSGKDSACALHTIREESKFEVVSLLTTVTDDYNRISMHGVREELLDLQAEAIGIPLEKIRIPRLCSNTIYEEKMAPCLSAWKNKGVRHVIFGDLFLEDLRKYREEKLSLLGMKAVFPLWKRDTGKLARQMIQKGFKVRLTCIDPKKLPKNFSGRAFDESLLADLPQNIDPCGENGEFHTFAHAGPIFKKAIPIRQGKTVERDGFIFTDFLQKRGNLRQSFPFSVSSEARILILGSMPGQKSLEAQQYYAHPHNLFWDVMGGLFGAGRQLEYQKRLQILKEHRIALWDVVFQCRRSGSLDSNIRAATPNNFRAFFVKYSRIHSVFFNGQKAEQLFKKLVLNNLGETAQKLRFVRLPSTSPAHASLTRDQKKARWCRELALALR
jgi:hypoxanthine-DNA glycosylase